MGTGTGKIREEMKNTPPIRNWTLSAEHSIQDNGLDSREVMFQFSQMRWQESLHSKLFFLVLMLRLLCKQVYPEYSLVDPAPQELHLHEAIQRVLLTYIWKMKDSDHILLGEKLRVVSVYHYDVWVHTEEPLSFGSKRL
jgi:hypothetical protein